MLRPENYFPGRRKTNTKSDKYMEIVGEDTEMKKLKMPLLDYKITKTNTQN